MLRSRMRKKAASVSNPIATISNITATTSLMSFKSRPITKSCPSPRVTKIISLALRSARRRPIPASNLKADAANSQARARKETGFSPNLFRLVNLDQSGVVNGEGNRDATNCAQPRIRSCNNGRSSSERSPGAAKIDRVACFDCYIVHLRSPSDFGRLEATFDPRRLRFLVADIRKRSVIENGRSSISNREKDTE